MKILDRYIGKTVISMTLLVTITLVGLEIFIQLVNELRDVGKGSYGLQEALIYVVLKMPYYLYLLFPLAGLVGGLLGLGSLATHSELTVMRVAGVSVQQISRAVLGAILILVFVVTLLGEVIAPKLTAYADTRKGMAKSGGQAISTQAGLWLREGNSFIHIATVVRGGHLANISRYQFDKNHHLVLASHVAKATYHQGQWQLEGVRNSVIKETGVTTSTVAADNWQINLTPEVVKIAQNDPEDMSLWKLYSLMQYKKQNNLDYTDYGLPFWKRIFQPFATCVMMFLAIPFIFGPLRSVTMGLRLVTGILVGFSFYILNQFFGPLSTVYQVPVVIAAILPTLLFAALGFVLLRRVR